MYVATGRCWTSKAFSRKKDALAYANRVLMDGAKTVEIYVDKAHKFPELNGKYLVVHNKEGWTYE